MSSSMDNGGVEMRQSAVRGQDQEPRDDGGFHKRKISVSAAGAGERTDVTA